MGFVHRDVKPGNILFRSNGAAVLADFGIAKAIKSISSATMAGNAIGTPDYMSPGAGAGESGRWPHRSCTASARCCSRCSTGRKPYVANDPYAVALRHVTDPVPRLPETLAWLQPLIDRTMAKDREQRFATGDAFIAACDALLREHPECTDGRRATQRTPRAPVQCSDAGWQASDSEPRALMAAAPRLGVAAVRRRSCSSSPQRFGLALAASVRRSASAATSSRRRSPADVAPPIAARADDRSGRHAGMSKLDRRPPRCSRAPSEYLD